MVEVQNKMKIMGVFAVVCDDEIQFANVNYEKVNKFFLDFPYEASLKEGYAIFDGDNSLINTQLFEYPDVARDFVREIY